MHPSRSTPPLPPQLFFSTPEQRLALARERFFEEGVRPSGLVGESVIQSWSRCMQAHRAPGEAVSFDPVTPSRVHSALARSRLLIESAASELSQLESTLAGTSCTVILTDPDGVVVHVAQPSSRSDEVLLPLAGRVGVNLSEEQIGTNAPGVSARTGEASVVLGGEHYFGCMRVVHCAAAPIRDVHGHVAGVLDVSVESRPFGFDAAAVVGMHATAIENRLLRAQSAEHIVVHLQTAPGLLGTPMEGLVGIAPDGRAAWINGAAARLLGIAGPDAVRQAADLLGLDMRALAALTRRPEPSLQRLPSGLNVWLIARMQARDGAAHVYRLGTAASGASRATSSADAVTLRDSDRHLIERTVAACNGNVARAARTLGVSRGLVYRRLRQARAEAAD
ncbi:MAG: GAF domain-containing protein [Proteobacteria bacterium]|nr:GAF domain-containing protein [Pseudomonadota bacterium]